ncbi:MAG TPA: hypothetical protein VF051_04445 [Hyphomicrobiaceae bacterium]
MRELQHLRSEQIGEIAFVERDDAFPLKRPQDVEGRAAIETRRTRDLARRQRTLRLMKGMENSDGRDDRTDRLSECPLRPARRVAGATAFRLWDVPGYLRSLLAGAVLPRCSR